jgi:hypothetical protein
MVEFFPGERRSDSSEQVMFLTTCALGASTLSR